MLDKAVIGIAIGMIATAAGTAWLMGMWQVSVLLATPLLCAACALIYSYCEIRRRYPNY